MFVGFIKNILTKLKEQTFQKVWKVEGASKEVQLHYKEEKVSDKYVHSEYLFYFSGKVLVEPQAGVGIIGGFTILSNTLFYKNQRPSILKRINPLKKKAKLTDCVIFDYSVGKNYFHFFVDVLPKVFLLKSKGLAQKEVLISKQLFNKPYFQSVINNSSIFNGISLRVVDCNTFIESEGLYYLRPMPFEFKYLKMMRESLMHLGDGMNGFKRIFIDRTRESGRFIANKKEVSKVLLKYSFTTVYPHEHDLREQVGIFSQAEIIVGIHGAGLTNLLWANNNAKVLEILPSNRRANHYTKLASELGLSHQQIVGGKLDQLGVYPEGGFHFDAMDLDMALNKILVPDER